MYLIDLFVFQLGKKATWCSSSTFFEIQKEKLMRFKQLESFTWTGKHALLHDIIFVDHLTFLNSCNKDLFLQLNAVLSNHYCFSIYLFG